MPRHLITSALPYINGVKHLGNLIGSMLPADVYARYLREKGEEVLFICATDEHGTPAELAAIDTDLSVQEYCDKQHEIQADIYKQFGLSFDYFGRSSSRENRELTQHFGRLLYEKGWLDTKESLQAYSNTENRFLPDRFILGTCPNCGYGNARGDQCESCTTLLDPKDLISPYSAISGTKDIEFRPSKNLFLRLDLAAGKLKDWLVANDKNNWTIQVTGIAQKWLNEGLLPRSITRDLSWGVPVDIPGFKGKVYYVWFDAPIEYIGATKEWASAKKGRAWKTWWNDAKDVRYTQFMAKDNVPFHAILWPAVLMASEEPWKQADYIKSFNWLTYYGGKFSTSLHRGIFMDGALEIAPADYWRYYLLANAPESNDTSFTWESFQKTVNKDLAGILGNFVHRTESLTFKFSGAQIPAGKILPDVAKNLLLERLGESLKNYEQALTSCQFRQAIVALRTCWMAGNQFLDDRSPWSQGISSESKGDTLRIAMNLCRLFAIISGPVIPGFKKTLCTSLNLAESETNWPNLQDLEKELSLLIPNRSYIPLQPVFPRLGGTNPKGWCEDAKNRFQGLPPTEENISLNASKNITKDGIAFS